MALEMRMPSVGLLEVDLVAQDLHQEPMFQELCDHHIIPRHCGVVEKAINVTWVYVIPMFVHDIPLRMCEIAQEGEEETSMTQRAPPYEPPATAGVVAEARLQVLDTSRHYFALRLD